MAAETTADAQRLEIYEIAEAIAPTWERRRADVEAVCASIRDWMVNVLSLRVGDTVLELAAGVGDTGFELLESSATRAASSRPTSPPRCWPRLAAVAPNGASPNVEYRVMDAEQIELEADSVDAVVCRLGYMLMAHPANALAETRRVLPGRPPGARGLGAYGAKPVLHDCGP